MEIIEPVSEAYRTGVAAFHGELDRAMAKAGGPAEVARIVQMAAEAKRPKLRYQVGREARLLRSLRRFVPERAFDRSLRKQFGIS